jgi:hypothetical protein
MADQDFGWMIDESWRVLKPGGRLLFLDPIWVPSWLPGRLVWRIDQGSHPRSEDQMRDVIERRFDFEREVRYAVHHRYFMALARPRSEM